MSIRCIKFRPFVKNTLKAFVDLELSRVGIIVRDCCWHSKNDSEWISFPARQYQDKAGKTQWSPTVEFAEGAREARAAFQAQALEAVHAAAAKETAG